MFGTVPVCPVPVWISYRTCRSVRYRHGFRTELTEESGTGIDVVPNLPKCPVPVLMYRTYGSVRYRYESLYRYRRYRYSYRTELADMSGTGIDVPNFLKCLVPVLMSCRIHRWVRYRYLCTEVTEASGTGVDVVQNLPSVPCTDIYVVPNLPKCLRYRY